MTPTFYSNGKLLITAEYLVLDGATALAFPTKYGQDMVVSPGSGQTIKWTSRENDGAIWFEDTYSFSEICNPDYVEKNDSVRNTLLEILHEAWLKNPDFLKSSDGYEIETNLGFPKNWGLGTSSTLINNIAQWLKIDAFKLLKDSFGGSGYDIACAQNDTPITYRIENEKPVVEQVAFDKDFSEHIYFVYLNRKQSSKAAIASYYANRNDQLDRLIPRVNKITANMLSAQDLKSFVYEMEKHESILSDILEMQTVKEALFPDFDGALKSLGGWGGDFIMAVCRQNPAPYFAERGYHTIVAFSEMIL